MTLILDLDMVKIYLHTKNEACMWSGSEQMDTQIDRQIDTQTDRHDQKHYLPAYAGGNEPSITQKKQGHVIELLSGSGNH